MIHRAPQPLLQNMRLDLFVGAAEVPCRATLLDRDELLGGEEGWVQLRLEHPIAAARGDRFIVRQPSPSHTIGGGRVVDTQPPRHRRFRPEVSSALEALARGTPGDLLGRALGDGQPHHWPELLKSSGLPAPAAAEGLAALVAGGAAIVLGGARQAEGERGRRGDQEAGRLGALVEIVYVPPLPLSPSPPLPISRWVISTGGWATLRERLTTALRGYHRRYPLRMGMPREELRSRLKLSGEGLEVVLATATVAGLAATHEGGVRLPDHAPTPAPEQERAVRRLLEGFAAAPYSPPALDLEPELVGWLVEQGKIVRVAEDVAFTPQAYAEMVDWVRERIGAGEGLSVAQFRDHFGTSRKYALALLEHLDERKVTRRMGDVRVLY
jgi:selenocysteine-specific elongation factor